MSGRPVHRRGKVVRRVVADPAGTAVLVIFDWETRCGYCGEPADPSWARCASCSRIFDRAAPSFDAIGGTGLRPDLPPVEPIHGNLHDLEGS